MIKVRLHKGHGKICKLCKATKSNVKKIFLRIFFRESIDGLKSGNTDSFTLCDMCALALIKELISTLIIVYEDKELKLKRLKDE
jgi:hypothetical protein